METTITDRGAGLRHGLLCSVAALGPVGVLGPLAIGVAGGIEGPRRLALAILLLETAYLFGAACCAGLLRLRGRASLAALTVVVSGAAITLFAAMISGGSVAALLRAQPVALATAVLGWGIGRAARDACDRTAPAVALASVTALVFATSLLPTSHVSPLLTSRPTATGVLLAANPFVAVASSAGYDLVRQEPLYNALTLADYQFRYPDPLWSVLVCVGLGLALGLVRWRTGAWTHSPARAVAMIGLLCLVFPAPLHASEPPSTPSRLTDLLQEPVEPSVVEVVAAGSELLSLTETRRAAVERWVRRGGRLLLTGEAVEPAVQLWNPHGCVEETCRVGLGEVVRVLDAWPRTREASKSPSVALFPSMARLARSTMPSDRPLRVATAGRLLTFVFLLGLVLLLGRRSSDRWTSMGAGSLVLVFGLWPWWADASALRPDRTTQVDFVVDVDDGPALFWSVASLRAVGRRETVVRTGPGSWNLHELDSAVTPRTAPVFLLEVSRGSMVAGLAWLADDELEGRIAIEVGRRDDRVIGLVRNEFAKVWTDVRLLLPGLEPLSLEDLRPGEASLIDRESAHGNGGPRWHELTRGISLERARLIESVLETVVRPLLDRGEPVLLAWTDGPLRPARLTRGEQIDRGMTLLVGRGRSSR